MKLSMLVNRPVQLATGLLQQIQQRLLGCLSVLPLLLELDLDPTHHFLEHVEERGLRFLPSVLFLLDLNIDALDLFRNFFEDCVVHLVSFLGLGQKGLLQLRYISLQPLIDSLKFLSPHRPLLLHLTLFQ